MQPGGRLLFVRAMCSVICDAEGRGGEAGTGEHAPAQDRADGVRPHVQELRDDARIIRAKRLDCAARSRAMMAVEGLHDALLIAPQARHVPARTGAPSSSVNVKPLAFIARTIMSPLT